MSRILIKKILKENIEDFEWTKELTENPYETGRLFKESDLCFNDEDYCTINIHKNGDIVFVIEYDKWVQHTDLGDDDEWILSVLLNNPNYDGGGDYYELDNDEFNYVNLNNLQITRFQNILDIVSPGEDITNFYRDAFNDLLPELKHKTLIDLFTKMRDDYISTLGYQIQENRWRNTGDYLKGIIKNNGVDFELYNRFLTITIPFEKVLELFKKNQDLTDLYLKVSYPITRENWSSTFYEEWDTSGSERALEGIIDGFLDEAEDYIQLDEEFESQRRFIEILDDLGFKISKTGNDYVRNNNDGSSWVLKPTKDEKVHLKFYSKPNSFFDSPTKAFTIPQDKVADYVSNYFLDI